MKKTSLSNKDKYDIFTIIMRLTKYKIDEPLIQKFKQKNLLILKEMPPLAVTAFEDIYWRGITFKKEAKKLKMSVGSLQHLMQHSFKKAIEKSS